MNRASSTDTPFLPGVPFWRRLLTMFYDGLIISCVVFIAWQPMPLLPDEHWPDGLSQGLRLLYLFLIPFFFLGWFWVHGGQTIGMRAWKIRLIDSSSTSGNTVAVSWKKAFLRYCSGYLSWPVLALGFLWPLFSRQRRTWHGLASGTRLIIQPRLPGSSSFPKEE